LKRSTPTLNNDVPSVKNAGVRGLGSQSAEAFLVAEDAAEFARVVAELLRNKAACARLSENARAAMHSWRLQQLTALETAVKEVTAQIQFVSGKPAPKAAQNSVQSCVARNIIASCPYRS